MDEALLSKGERTRQAILEAAYELFIEQGYTATSMRQIAKRADLALSGIYNHFHNKEAIFAELLLERHPYRQVLPILLKTPTGEIEAFVRTAAHGMVAELSRQSGFIKLMLIEIVEFNACHMPQVISHVFPEVLPIIERFVQAGHCLREIPPVVLFRAFIGLFFSYYLTELIVSGTHLALNQSNAFDHFVDIFLHGILKSPSEDGLQNSFS